MEQITGGNADPIDINTVDLTDEDTLYARFYCDNGVTLDFYPQIAALLRTPEFQIVMDLLAETDSQLSGQLRQDFLWLQEEAFATAFYRDFKVNRSALILSRLYESVSAMLEERNGRGTARPRPVFVSIGSWLDAINKSPGVELFKHHLAKIDTLLDGELLAVLANAQGLASDFAYYDAGGGVKSRHDAEAAVGLIDFLWKLQGYIDQGHNMLPTSTMGFAAITLEQAATLRQTVEAESDSGEPVPESPAT